MSSLKPMYTCHLSVTEFSDERFDAMGGDTCNISDIDQTLLTVARICSTVARSPRPFTANFAASALSV